MAALKHVAVFALALCVCVAGYGAEYEASWESLDSRDTPGWFSDAKLGIFIHWGVYSVPAWGPKGTYSEWYWQNTHEDDGTVGKLKDNEWGKFHEKNYGKDFAYFDFAPKFRCELYDPDEWADFFYRSGAKYIVLTSKHHDGFCLWPSKEANKTWGRKWNSVDIGPKRDLLGELTEAVRKRDIKMGFYYSLYEWFNPLWLSDRERYVNEHMMPQFKDVVSRYKPSIIFSDGEWDEDAKVWKSEEFLAWLFNESACRDEVVVNDRWGKGARHKHGGYFTTEYGAGLEDATHPWEECRGMGHSFGYSRNENLDDYRTGRELVLMLVDIVSRGGNLLLDIGPTGDGRIPVIMQQRLVEIGDWLKVNGEAIYGTRPWEKNCQWSKGERPELEYGKEWMAKYDIKEITEKGGSGKAVVEAFFTKKENTLYAICPNWPGRELVLEVGRIPAESAVVMLGCGEKLQWELKDNRVVIDLSGIAVNDSPYRYGYTFKMPMPKTD